ncbi:MAG: EAL domain-containing protein [Thermomonas sp.]
MMQSIGFRSRILLAFIALLAGALLTTLGIVSIAADRSVQSQLSDRLELSERVWSELLQANADRLVESVSLLAKDFAFREAVATGDDPTAQTVLLNHGLRIHADVALLLQPDGTLRSSIQDHDPKHAETALAPVLRMAEQAGTANDVVLLDGEPYLVAVVPVLAPRRIAWVVMGVRYGEAFAKQYKALVGLDVTLLEPSQGHLNVRASTLSEVQRQTLASLATTIAGQQLRLAGNNFATRIFNAAETPKGAIRVMLLADIDQAMRPNRLLKRNIMLLTAMAAVVALLLAVLVGRGISRPITLLAVAATRIGHGDYAEPLPVHGRDELAELARAFNSMQSGIEQREARIQYQASHDALTGLPNRSTALYYLDAAIASSKAVEGACCVVMLDLDRFKEINDTLGHAFGDEVLREVAARLREDVSDGDMLARLGGDEFLVILEAAGAEAGVERALALVALIDQPFLLGEAQVSLDASIGIAAFPEHATDAASLLRRADIAMYEAKSLHSRVAVYKPGRDENHLHQLALMGELKFAQERNQLSLAFQPKIDLRSGTVADVEALLRWTHPKFGKIGPDEFIPLAERSGVISALTRYVIDEALRVAGSWMREHLIDSVAINLSAIDLLDQELPAFVRDRLAAHGVVGQHLVFEITESTAMRDLGASLEIMHELRACGVRLSIDDFGTGHSSLAQLRSLPVDEIKIDKSFIMLLGGEQDDSVIVRSAIEIGHNMGLSVIAEGVEDVRSLAILQSLNCDMVQGYLFSPPLAAADFPDWHAAFSHNGSRARCEAS